jgi:hypothetical protein
MPKKASVCYLVRQVDDESRILVWVQTGHL